MCSITKLSPNETSQSIGISCYSIRHLNPQIFVSSWRISFCVLENFHVTVKKSWCPCKMTHCGIKIEKNGQEKVFSFPECRRYSRNMMLCVCTYARTTHTRATHKHTHTLTHTLFWFGGWWNTHDCYDIFVRYISSSNLQNKKLIRNDPNIMKFLPK